VAGANLLQALTNVEQVSLRLRARQAPSMATLAELDGSGARGDALRHLRRAAAGRGAAFALAVFGGRVSKQTRAVRHASTRRLTGRLASTGKEIQA
jgi:hypothetical protein